jgi:hypothetical protein
MNKKIRHLLFLALIVLLATLPSISLAQAISAENDLRTSSGLEWSSIIIAASGILATVLSIIIAIAYRRSRRKKLIYVGAAFLLFAIKSFLLASDIFIPKGSWVDPTANLLDFVILLSFFFGIVKK